MSYWHICTQIVRESGKFTAVHEQFTVSAKIRDVKGAVQKFIHKALIKNNKARMRWLLLSAEKQRNGTP